MVEPSADAQIKASDADEEIGLDDEIGSEEEWVDENEMNDAEEGTTLEEVSADKDKQIPTLDEEKAETDAKPRPTLADDDNDIDLDDHDLDYFDYDDDLLDDRDIDDQDPSLVLLGNVVDDGEEEEQDSEEEGSEDEIDEDEEDEEEGDEKDEDEEEEEPMDEATLELLSRALSIETFEKEELILIYLEIMKRVRILKNHNRYIQDYLTRLCLRKRLIRSTGGGPNSSNNDTSKYHSTHHHHHRHHRHGHRRKSEDANRPKTPYEVFRDNRKPDDEKRPPDRGMLNRARKIQRPDQRAPTFLRKVEIRVVTIHGKTFQRVLRSKARDWNEEILENEDLKKNKARDVQIGHPDVPKAYQRTLLPYHDKPKVVDQKAKTGPKSKRKPRQRLFQKIPAYNPYFEFGGPKSNRTGTGRRKSGGLELKKSLSAASARASKVQVHPCVRIKKFRRFRQPKWFPKGASLKGRKVSGHSLLDRAQRGSWEAILEKERKENKQDKDHDDPELRPSQVAANDWVEALDRLYLLLEAKAAAETAHEISIAEKLEDWKLWENRNMMSVGHLFDLLRDFVLQPYYSQGEARSFRKEVASFGDQLHRAHSSLMAQLYRQARASLNLLLLQRLLKGKTNQGLAKHGYSIADYELRVHENRQFYETVLKKEAELEQQADKLTSRIKGAERCRYLRERKVADVLAASKGIQVVHHDASRGGWVAEGAMVAYNTLLKQNKEILLQATVVDKPHLLQDFTTRKRAMQHFELEVNRRRLAREVYQREREITAIGVKSRNVKRNLYHYLSEKRAADQAKMMEDHKAWVGGKFENAVQKALARCGLMQSAIMDQDNNGQPK